ncbi:MAG: radical SAM family heme chaperone HemW, partial [Muribaculaceae bacterium]|nr:radical SAM family heme chaperone HemW [Muribaculaceae bacterium]
MAGLYIHIPFCHSKCAYCDFYSRPSKNCSGEYRSFAYAAVREYEKRALEYLIANGKFGTAYIGGGTPSVMPLDIIGIILDKVVNDVETGGEITLECNPEDVTASAIRGWLDSGVNRISMGIQSFEDNELIAVGRRHSAKDALTAVDTLRSQGISNISLDLIYGLPEQTFESWRHSVERLLALRPEHFSAYALSVEAGTRLYARMLAGRFTPMSDDEIVRMYDFLCIAARNAGYEHYEISNFALPGYRASHNSSYWRYEPYLGIGPSAVSFDGRNTRTTNSNDLTEYIHGRSIVREIEQESLVDRVNDVILTALRTSDGLE